MENLEDIFKIEANELLADLEACLVKLETNQGDKSLAERVFRIMHTLKGNCNMFGYEKIGEFLHSLENVYDLIRKEKASLDNTILNLSLECLDHLKNIINDPTLSAAKNQENHNQLTGRLQETARHSANGKGESEKADRPETIKTYYILLRPVKLPKKGTNPLYVINELCELGEYKITPHCKDLPELDAIDPAKPAIYWDIYLATAQPRQTIEETFLFVQKDCRYEIHEVAEGNLLQNKDFISHIDEELSFSEDIDIKGLKEFASSLFQLVRQREKEEANAANIKENVISSIRVSSGKLDELMNLVSELVTTQASLSLFSERSDSPELAVIAENIEKITRRLRDTAFGICLVPVESLLTRFQRLVRDLSMELGKHVEFVAEGAETELDKSIIEALADPLLHIFRNAIDHGIEDAETRLRLGKPEKGRITFKAFYAGAHVMIRIADDGRGVDPAKVKSTAVKQGLIEPETILTERETFDLLFAPGFSTARSVTEVSGRGVGMDVVKRKITDIRGDVWMESKKGEGSTLSIKLPLTLSIIDGLLIRVEETFFIIPLTYVAKCYETKQDALADNFNNLTILDDQRIPFINLREEFRMAGDLPETLHAVTVKYEDSLAALFADEIIGEYQAVLKPLGKLYHQTDMVSGGAILGDGTVALVLDVNSLIKNFSDAITKPEVIL